MRRALSLIFQPVFIFIGSAAGLVLLLGIALGFHFESKIDGALEKATAVYEDLFTNPRTVPDKSGIQPGFKTYGELKDSGYLLLPAFFVDTQRAEVRLIELATGKVVKSWIPDPDEIRARSKYRWIEPATRFIPLHPYLMEDGGLTFIDTGPLVRIDSCSRIQWILDRAFHHSLEKDLEGNFLIPVQTRKPTTRQLPVQYQNDAVATVSRDGKYLGEKSVTDMLIENGYYGLFTITYPAHDPLHLNDIEVAHTSTNFWERGDLLLSVRQLNTVFIYRPSTGKIVWLRTGPWTKQHDPDFHPDGTVSVFGNDMIGLGKRPELIYGHSNLYVVDLATANVGLPYLDVMKAAKIGTPTQGRHRLLDNSDAFIEDSDYGRLYRASADGLLWSFNNSDGTTAGMLNWSRYLTKAEVEGVDLSASCGGDAAG
jgi:hypothetical protein